MRYAPYQSKALQSGEHYRKSKKYQRPCKRPTECQTVERRCIGRSEQCSCDEANDKQGPIRECEEQNDGPGAQRELSQELHATNVPQVSDSSTCRSSM
jgi:hypothetical protein